MKSNEVSMPKESKKKKSWSMREETGGFTKSINVKEAENGFIIEVSKYGRDENKKDSQYTDECKCYISKTNPLCDSEPDEKDEDVEFSLKGIDSAISDMMGGITI